MLTLAAIVFLCAMTPLGSSERASSMRHLGSVVGSEARNAALLVAAHRSSAQEADTLVKVGHSMTTDQ